MVNFRLIKTMFSVIALFSAITVFSQKEFQLKLGNDKMINWAKTGNDNIIDLKTSYHYYPLFGIEYSNNTKRKKNHRFVFALTMNSANVIRRLNYSNSNINFSNAITRYSETLFAILKLQAGYDNKLKPLDSKINRNYFSYQYGLNLHLVGRGSSRKIEDGTFLTLLNGSQVIGKYNFSQSPSFPIVPSIYGGIRYHILNRQGKEIVNLELQCNLMPISTIDHISEYTIDGATYRDGRRNSGVQLQFMITRRLWRK